MIQHKIQHTIRQQISKNDAKKVAKGLRTENGTTKLYLRPKIHHKQSPSTHFSYHLQPIIKEIPSYLKNTKDIFQKINQIEEIPEDSVLVPLDVKSLCTNISNNDGIKTIEGADDKHPNKFVSTKIITTFLSSILTLNNFLFNSVNYIQKMRRAMSNVWAPLYANLFMAQFEENHIYTYIKDMCFLYLPY